MINSRQDKMGIHALIKAVAHYPPNSSNYIIRNNYIYTNGAVYIDITSIIIRLYQKYFSSHTAKNITFDGLITFVTDHLRKRFNKILTAVYVFADYRFSDEIIRHNAPPVMLPPIPDDERLSASPMIKRIYLDDLIVEGRTDRIRCMFELMTIFNRCRKPTRSITDFISLRYVLLNYSLSPIQRQNVERGINDGLFRYYYLRGCKRSVKQTRYRSNWRVFNNTHGKVNGNATLTMYNAYTTNNTKTIAKYNSYIPFSAAIFMLPSIIKSIDNPNVQYYGCGLDSDFVLHDHLRTYSLHRNALVYTSDTDLFALLSDVDCTIRFVNKSIRCFIRPIDFWYSIFNCHLSHDIIITLCVLLGTDFNPVKTACCPLHINEFSDILFRLGVGDYSEITIDKLNDWILRVYSRHPTECFSTMMALMIYRRQVSERIHPLAGNDVSADKLMEYTHATVIRTS